MQIEYYRIQMENYSIQIENYAKQMKIYAIQMEKIEYCIVRHAIQIQFFKLR